MLIESALWDALNIAQTGRKLGINSDARYRFERGVDPAFMLPGLELATQMVIDFCGGDSVRDRGRRRPERPKEAVIDFPLTSCRGLPASNCRSPRSAACWSISASSSPARANGVKVAVPSWRPDVHGRPTSSRRSCASSASTACRSTPFPRGDACAQAGADADPEPHPQGQARACRARADRSRDLVVRRPSAKPNCSAAASRSWRSPIRSPPTCPTCGRACIPGLVTAAQRNADRGFADVALFEVGQVFKGDRPEDQFTAAAGVRRALAKAGGIGRHWSAQAKAGRCLRRQGRRLRRARRAGAPMQALQVVPGGPAWFHPGRAGTIQIGPQNVLGPFGELHPRTLAALDAEGPLVGFEVILEQSPSRKAKATRAKPCSSCRRSSRSSAISPSSSTARVKAADVVRAAQNVDRKLITDVTRVRRL